MDLFGKKRTYWVITLLIIMWISACSTVNLEEIDNLNENQILVIGHGGLGFDSPQNHIPINSFTAITRAVEDYSADGVEIDIQMSADNVLMMYHDQKLESMTDCSGTILEKNEAELINCRYRNGISANVFMNEHLTPLETVIKRFAKRDTKPIIILDVKTTLPDSFEGNKNEFLNSLAEKIDDIFTRYTGTSWMILDTGDLELIKRVQELNPAIKSIWLRPLTEEFIEEAVANNFYGISNNNQDTSREMIEKAHDAGLVVSLYSVKIRSGTVAAANKYPDFIETDNIPLLQEILKQ